MTSLEGVGVFFRFLTNSLFSFYQYTLSTLFLKTMEFQHIDTNFSCAMNCATHSYEIIYESLPVVKAESRTVLDLCKNISKHLRPVVNKD